MYNIVNNSPAAFNILGEGQGRGESIKKTVKDIVALFQKILQLFSQCHNIYNKKLVSQEEVTELGK